MTEPRANMIDMENALGYFESCVANTVQYVTSCLVEPQTFGDPKIRARLDKLTGEITQHFAEVIGGIQGEEEKMGVAAYNSGYSDLMNGLQDGIPEFIQALRGLAFIERQ